MEPGFMYHKCVTGGTLLLAGGTTESGTGDMTCLHMILHMGYFLGVVATLSALPAACLLVFEHEVAHNDVETFQGLGINSLARQVRAFYWVAAYLTSCFLYW